MLPVPVNHEPSAVARGFHPFFQIARRYFTRTILVDHTTIPVHKHWNMKAASPPVLFYSFRYRRIDCFSARSKHTARNRSVPGNQKDEEQPKRKTEEVKKTAFEKLIENESYLRRRKQRAIFIKWIVKKITNLFINMQKTKSHFIRNLCLNV